MRRSFAVVLLVGVVLTWGAARAETPEAIFGRGNAAYEQGRYAEAVAAYETVLRYGIRDARVEYNLGNACYKSGRLGQAILHYEKAFRLAPTDPDIRANLDLARSRRFDRVEEPEVAWIVRSIRGVQDRVGPDRHALAFLALVWVAAALLTWALARPRGWSATMGWALAVVLLAATVVGVSGWVTHGRLEGAVMAVVLEEAVEVLAGPGENNASLFTVHEGLTLEVQGEREEWVQVSLPNGLHGWVPRATLGFV